MRLNSHEIVELLDCKTVRNSAFSSTREQSNKRSLTPRFTDFFTDFEKTKTDCFAVYWVVLWSFIAPCIVHSAYETLHHMSFQDLCHVTLPLQCLRATVITYNASVIYLWGDFLLTLIWIRAEDNETLYSGFKEWRCLISLYIFLNTCKFPKWYICVGQEPNCPPTPPLSQHFALISVKWVLMLT